LFHTPQSINGFHGRIDKEQAIDFWLVLLTLKLFFGEYHLYIPEIVFFFDIFENRKVKWRYTWGNDQWASTPCSKNRHPTLVETLWERHIWIDIHSVGTIHTIVVNL
jgi:hypothetical protein